MTRDAWTFPHDMDHLLFFGRTTLPSLTSPPAAVDLSRLALDSPWQRRAVTSDIAKTILPSLEAFDPDVLLLDCVNERYDLFRAGGTLVTRSEEFVVGGGEALDWGAEPEVVPRLSNAAQRLWADGAMRFADWVRRVLRRSRIIVHRAPWAVHFRAGASEDSPLRPFPPGEYAAAGTPVDPRPYAALTSRYHDALLTLLPGAEPLEVDSRFHVGDPHHRWGPAPFHYIAAYYRDFRARAAALGIDLGAGTADPACASESGPDSPSAESREAAAAPPGERYAR